MIKRVVKWFQKSCSSCEGTGVTYCHCNEQYEISCPHCMGKGVIEKVITSTNIVEIPCDHPGCQKGKISCGYCGGKGQLANGEKCPQCHGAGMTTCMVCGGSGRIERPYQEQWVKHEICPTCHGKAYIPCPHCHGTKNRICPVCHGSGVVLDKTKIVSVLLLLFFTAAMPMIAITIMGFILTGVILSIVYQRFLAKDEIIIHSSEKTTDEKNKK